MWPYMLKLIRRRLRKKSHVVRDTRSLGSPAAGRISAALVKMGFAVPNKDRAGQGDGGHKAGQAPYGHQQLRKLSYD